MCCGIPFDFPDRAFTEKAAAVVKCTQECYAIRDALLDHHINPHQYHMHQGHVTHQFLTLGAASKSKYTARMGGSKWDDTFAAAVEKLLESVQSNTAKLLNAAPPLLPPHAAGAPAANTRSAGNAATKPPFWVDGGMFQLQQFQQETIPICSACNNAATCKSEWLSIWRTSAMTRGSEKKCPLIATRTNDVNWDLYYFLFLMSSQIAICTYHMRRSHAPSVIVSWRLQRIAQLYTGYIIYTLLNLRKGRAAPANQPFQQWYINHYVQAGVWARLQRGTQSLEDAMQGGPSANVNYSDFNVSDLSMQADVLNRISEIVDTHLPLFDLYVGTDGRLLPQANRTLQNSKLSGAQLQKALHGLQYIQPGRSYVQCDPNVPMPFCVAGAGRKSLTLEQVLYRLTWGLCDYYPSQLRRLNHLLRVCVPQTYSVMQKVATRRMHASSVSAQRAAIISQYIAAMLRLTG
jgi:hypothetical protein